MVEDIGLPLSAVADEGVQDIQLPAEIDDDSTVGWDVSVTVPKEVGRADHERPVCLHLISHVACAKPRDRQVAFPGFREKDRDARKAGVAGAEHQLGLMRTDTARDPTGTSVHFYYPIRRFATVLAAIITMTQILYKSNCAIKLKQTLRLTKTAYRKVFCPKTDELRRLSSTVWDPRLPRSGMSTTFRILSRV